MTVKLMISKTPVLALFGDLGCGKTSTLNLLQEHLADKAIVVFFSTWLPGSQETFITYLLSDIANECQKRYVVPGLRKSAQRLAKALGQNVPLLRTYLGLLPESTQRDDIANIHAALARLPKRVIVLLDELDRMEQEEITTLLKVIRGISHLPNLSFVCAGDFKTIVQTVKGDFNEENRAYFEKFFFDITEIPQLDPAAMRKAGTQRLVATFNRRNWFEHEIEEESFRRQIDAIWDRLIAPFCRNLRALGLLANAVGAAAAPLIREVHPIDLTLVELLRRFKPQIHKIVARNPAVLTGGVGFLRGGTYHRDEERKELGRGLIAEIQQVTPAGELEAVKAILGELFPFFREIDQPTWTVAILRRGIQIADEENPKRIRQPEIFPAYFRHQLPEAIFSSMEMEAFLRRLDDTSKSGNGDCVFEETLDSMEKGSLKRDDFLRKLSMAASKSMALQTGKHLVRLAMKAAHKYTYEIVAGLGEAGHVLRIVIRIAERLSPPERFALLEACILDATDDTMARNVLRLSETHADFALHVPRAELYPAFQARMRGLYGRDVDATNIDLSTSDPFAFNTWGFDFKDAEIPFDPEDRAIQRDFWVRYIGSSRSRLADAFRRFFLPTTISFSDDPTPFVEGKIALADLRRLYEDLRDDGTLNKDDLLSLSLLGRFLKGEFKDGVGPGLYSDKDTGLA